MTNICLSFCAVGPPQRPQRSKTAAGGSSTATGKVSAARGSEDGSLWRLGVADLQSSIFAGNMEGVDGISRILARYTKAAPSQAMLEIMLPDAESLVILLSYKVHHVR